MKFLSRLLFVLLFLLPLHAFAQTQVIVVTTCGTQSLSGSVGTRGIMYMDILGNLCSSDTISNATINLGVATYPLNSVPETISATGTTTAFTATLAASASGQKTYICGVEIDAAATVGTVVPWTLTGTITGTMNFLEFVSTLAGVGTGRNVYNFRQCIPSSAVNTPIVVNAGAAGAGGIASISAWGYQN